MALIIAGCLVISALSLIYPSTPTYDPWAWILWGREIAHLDLVTEGGPSWKPFPIFFTVPFALRAGPRAVPVALGGARGRPARLRDGLPDGDRLIGGRVYGVLAGVSAFAALLSSNKYVRDAALGNSEPILAAVVLWAFERHSTGGATTRSTSAWRRRCCAPRRGRLGLYGLWLWFYEPRLRMRLVAFAALVPACWFLPVVGARRAVPRRLARERAQPRQRAFADHPAIELFKRFAESTVAPVELGHAGGCRRGRRGLGTAAGARRSWRSRRSGSPGSCSWR